MEQQAETEETELEREIRESTEKKRANDFIDQLLVKCKHHRGPITSVHEVKALVCKKSPELKTLRQEIQYQ